MTDTIKKAAERVYRAREVLRAHDMRNIYGVGLEDRVKMAEERALAERELKLANDEYFKHINA